MTSNTSISILKLTHKKAKEFFLTQSSYTNIDLPPYYCFQNLLDFIDNFLDTYESKSNGKKLDSISKFKQAKTTDINYHIYSNKDSGLSWRELQLVNPIIYVYLVRLITQQQNWKKIKNIFKGFQKNKKIECLSIPIKSLTENSDKAEQISNWWSNVEQRSIELSLDFDYIFETDIADCYGSIYTHSIAWAIETKHVAKTNQHDKDLFGNQVDDTIQLLQYGQTNGIPQGSTLMDFIAEIVLGYIDQELTEELKYNYKSIKEYKILRYRDDYRVFCNNIETGSLILKVLSEKLLQFGMRLNSSKTKNSSNVITSSIKPDRISNYLFPKHYLSAQERLMIIRENSFIHPNSSSLKKQLHKLYLKMSKKNNFIQEKDVVILSSIMIDILIRNSSVFPIGFAIISFLLSKSNNSKTRDDIINSINKKLKQIPNIGYIEIWFKRLLMDAYPKIILSEKICDKNSKNSDIWNIDWVTNNDLKIGFDKHSIFNLDIYNQLDLVINRQEVSLFLSDY